MIDYDWLWLWLWSLTKSRKWIFSQNTINLFYISILDITRPLSIYQIIMIYKNIIVTTYIGSWKYRMDKLNSGVAICRSRSFSWRLCWHQPLCSFIIFLFWRCHSHHSKVITSKEITNWSWLKSCFCILCLSKNVVVLCNHLLMELELRIHFHLAKIRPFMEALH